ncbi:alanine--tRNA ligase [Candidatus Kinetoplastidibacterium crithidiae]|uniref:Alanine--tRNA ligase n=1 Tax=Candidatus Kinetoplastidibacterium crithidiae TCC036E TaxID=1208918 RepID=M1LUA8_9PROT|nr:alanine--tRNA ligase [Candidatus Kinetoplastibacterium crithidii]AFZ82653.1 alanyl-tRNA synthetase [Candidatus Kinetoplastibacterium crithidii (ex Angomonas deanei ATCC 30255)]AGF47686.1 alanyl-tRNA synthetase [Candidatus Kinetoplastibacterium crithidii TCC036E]
MKTSEIRSKFLKFFESKNHVILPSSSLVPVDDPTLLFTNSGMVQFKDIFSGKEQASYKRIVTAQRCFRAGGKHNDLENVGYTARHHTFFEMLGNFSFGDYFKRDAIHYAWELLTKVYNIPSHKLFITVYHDDDEAYDIWHSEIGVPSSLISRIGDNKGSKFASDNFWQMSDTGPCGPCSEIFYDHGQHFHGDPPGLGNIEGDRYVEIWNLVFMQFYIDKAQNISRLQVPCIDTGMGLERIAAVLQNVHSNYDTDSFKKLIFATASKIGIKNYSDNSLKVISDHLRASVFLIVDGVLPSNDGRGYVLRRIIRRALRHSYKLGHSGSFLYKLVPDLILEMSDAYPEISKKSDYISKIILQEEDRFGDTLIHGMKILNSAISKVEHGNQLDDDIVFSLYDTYGFPIDLTADVCREKGISIDLNSFDKHMNSQRNKARSSGKFKSNIYSLDCSNFVSEFYGYENHKLENSKILAIYVNGAIVNKIDNSQEKVCIILDKTPFYAELGGQVGDTGVLRSNDAVFIVNNTFLGNTNVFVHSGMLQNGILQVGDIVSSCVDRTRRLNISKNHSATHLMHFALREILGSHVHQKGSLVDDERIRFDFTNDYPLSCSQISQIEELVNYYIVLNSDVITDIIPYEKAISSGAIALFNEKYSSKVRVVSIGPSIELCGGTHVVKTGDIGFFKITTESSISNGVRRIEACTALKAVNFVSKQSSLLYDIAKIFNSSNDELLDRISQYKNYVKHKEKENLFLRKKLASSIVEYICMDNIDNQDEIKLVSYFFADLDQSILLDIMDFMKNRFKKVIVVLGTNDLSSNKGILVCGVSNSIIEIIEAREIMNFFASCVQGKGGGRANTATGSTNDAKLLPDGIENTKKWILSRI